MIGLSAYTSSCYTCLDVIKIAKDPGNFIIVLLDNVYALLSNNDIVNCQDGEVVDFIIQGENENVAKALYPGPSSHFSSVGSSYVEAGMLEPSTPMTLATGGDPSVRSHAPTMVESPSVSIKIW